MNIYDIASNPAILCDAGVKAGDFFLSGVRLGDPCGKISAGDVYDTGFYTPIKGFDSLFWRDGKTYGTRNGVEREVKLDERIGLVMENGGWLMLNSGARYRIEKGLVVEFRIDDDLLKKFQQIKNGGIEEFFGIPDEVEEEIIDPFDGPVSRAYIYRGRMMRISWDCGAGEIDGINIGDIISVPVSGSAYVPYA